jgi:hypothetical protein
VLARILRALTQQNQGKKNVKRKEQEQFDWLAVEAGVDGEQVV